MRIRVDVSCAREQLAHRALPGERSVLIGQIGELGAERLETLAGHPGRALVFLGEARLLGTRLIPGQQGVSGSAARYVPPSDARIVERIGLAA